VALNENGPDGNISYVYGSSIISASATGLLSFYQFDGLGSVSYLTDQSTSGTARYSYDPFGTIIGGADTLGGQNKFKFTGQAADPNTGLIYLRARYYDPTQGHFLSRDAMPSDDRISRQTAYAYAADAPVQHVDPTGLSFDTFLQNYAQTISSLPSFAACGGGAFNFGDSCQKQGLSKEQVAFGNDVATTIIGISTGGVGLAFKTGIDLTRDTGH
jgi:RHS repeat-associated protein